MSTTGRVLIARQDGYHPSTICWHTECANTYKDGRGWAHPSLFVYSPETQDHRCHAWTMVCGDHAAEAFAALVAKGEQSEHPWFVTEGWYGPHHDRGKPFAEGIGRPAGTLF